jgi:hypothetical protein
MLTSLLAIGLSLVDPCASLYAYPEAGARADGALVDLAARRGVAETQAGAVLVLWRDGECPFVPTHLGDPGGIDAQRAAACPKVIVVPHDGEDLPAALPRVVTHFGPTLLAAAWAVDDADGGSHHVLVLTDGEHLLRIEGPHVGHPDGVELCHTEWTWPTRVEATVPAASSTTPRSRPRTRR